MTLPIFLAVLGAAFLHALWNALIRVGTSRVRAMMVLSAVQGLIGLAVALRQPWPGAEVWPWLLASGLIHSAYKIFLTFAYEHGDLSRVYPLARGSAPVIVLIVGGLALGEVLSGMETLGVVVLGLGILMLARGIWTDGENRRMVPFALLSATATAGYSMVDGLGARVSGDAVGYVGWLFIVDGIVFALVMLALRGRAAVPSGWQVWTTGALASAASYVSYAVAVWAMTLAPIPLVTALRETSILFAVLLGWLVFRERMTPQKAISAVLIVTGLVLTRI